MDEQKERGSQQQGPDEANPMAMGMARKMVAQMGQGGGPFEMMQRMMAQMSQGEGKPPMEKMMGMCMGMCSEMLNTIRQTNVLAVYATPELQRIFADWVTGLEAKTTEIIAKGEIDGAALAATLGVNEESANYILGRLATARKVTLAAKPRA